MRRSAAMSGGLGLSVAILGLYGLLVLVKTWVLGRMGCAGAWMSCISLVDDTESNREWLLSHVEGADHVALFSRGACSQVADRVVSQTESFPVGEPDAAPCALLTLLLRSALHRGCGSSSMFSLVVAAACNCWQWYLSRSLPLMRGREAPARQTGE